MRNAEAHLTLAIIVARQGDTEQADSPGMQALQIDAARPSRHVAGDRWFVDETYLKVAGRWVYLYRAIDQHVQIIDVLPSEKRDLAATRRFFARALGAARRPTEVTTDRAAGWRTAPPRGRPRARVHRAGRQLG